MVDTKLTTNKNTGTKKDEAVSSESDGSESKKIVAETKKTPAKTASKKSAEATPRKTAVVAKSKAKAGSTPKKNGVKETSAVVKKKSTAEVLSPAQKKVADDAIKSRKSSDDLKARAAAAKKRAQEKILDKAYVSDPPTDPLERLANTFDSSARRWEMVVYPSLFAFVLLAGYGFFLIYRLTHDIATLSQSVTHMAVIVSDAMPRMTKDLSTMTRSMDNMTNNISDMSGDIGGMSTEISSMSGQMNSLTPMSKNIQSMTHNIGSMNRSVYGMQRDMHGMNRTVSSGPFGMMNDMMPFNSSTNVPPAMAPTPTWPSYNPTPQQSLPQRSVSHQPALHRNPMRQQNSVSKPGNRFAKKPQSLQTKNEKTQIFMPGASPVAIKDTPVKKNGSKSNPDNITQEINRSVEHNRNSK